MKTSLVHVLFFISQKPSTLDSINHTKLLEKIEKSWIQLFIR